jgi:hypothetical protein
MISIENYLTTSRNIDFDKLPVALKNGDKLAKGASANNWSAYNSNENIKRVVDAYLVKLNEWIDKNPEKKETEKPRPVKKAAATKEKKTMPTGRQAVAKKPEKKETTEEKEAEGVEKILPEVGFIKRYAGLHGKVKTQDEILRFLNGLQKAILEKRIRKTSPYAAEIEKIQSNLIKCYEKMGDSIEISIDKKTLERFEEIAHSQKTLLSVTYLKQYISLHGKKNVKDKAKALFTKIKNAVDKAKIVKNDPYAEKLNAVYNALNKYIDGSTPAPVISKSELNGLFTYIAKQQRKKKVAKHLHKIYELEHGMSGAGDEVSDEPLSAEIIPSTELAGMEFETIGLQGKYRELIGDPCVGFSAMVYGLPKSGKSTLCIDFAKYLAQHHGKVLYCAIEEKFGYTLKEKVERLHAIDQNLYVSETVPEDLSDYNFVFIDSVSRADLQMDDLLKLKNDNPKTSFVFIFHSTKNGNFRGMNQFAHDVDVIVKVENGKASGNGRFSPGGEIEF